MTVSNDSMGTSHGQRGEYVKPAMVAIELKAEEVLAVGCKAQARVIPNVNQAMGCGISNSCATEGS
jgi:hypothetical protein